MTLTDKRIQQMKDILEKNGNREYTWAEASKIAHNLEGTVSMLLDKWEKQQCEELGNSEV